MKSSGILRTAALALLTTAASGALQAVQGQSRSILTLLPSEGTVEVGSEVTGVLEAGDIEGTQGEYLDAWEFRGRAGDPVTIDVLAEGFDGYLYLVGPGYDRPETDDDSGNGCDPRLAVFLPSDGEFRVVVGSFGGGEGAYTLRIGQRAEPVGTQECSGQGGGFDFSMLSAAAGTITMGGSVDGALTAAEPLLDDGSRARAYDIDLDEGDYMVADLVSSEFDAVLFLVAGDGTEIAHDDDGGGGCNARIEFQVADAGRYRLVVNTLLSGSTGRFTLTVRGEAEPPSNEPCEPAGEAG